MLAALPPRSSRKAKRSQPGPRAAHRDPMLPPTQTMPDREDMLALLDREVVTAEGSVPWLVVAVHQSDTGPTVDLVSEYRGRTRRRYRVRFDLLRHPYTRRRLDVVEAVA